MNGRLKPFERAYYDPQDISPQRLAKKHGTSLEQARVQARRMRESVVWRNDEYEVAVSDRKDFQHLSIKRVDKEPIHDWRDLQQIKNLLLGPECEAVELYPAESRKADSANQYHLWGSKDPTFRFPVGFADRLVDGESPPGGKQRAFEQES